jgi:Uma2 family endonuclease
MEMPLPSDVEQILNASEGQLRRMKRVEYEHLAAQGFFEDEKVELLFGMVIPMAPIDPAHVESTRIVHERLLLALLGRAHVYCQSTFAATEDSAPEPDIFVTKPGTRWKEHHSHAYLVVEVARSSLRRDRVKRLIYAASEVEEYWIVNHKGACVEVYRDRRDGAWQTMTTHRRGETLSPLAFPDVTIAIDDILPPSA